MLQHGLEWRDWKLTNSGISHSTNFLGSAICALICVGYGETAQHEFSIDLWNNTAASMF